MTRWWTKIGPIEGWRDKWDQTKECNLIINQNTLDWRSDEERKEVERDLQTTADEK